MDLSTAWPLGIRELFSFLKARCGIAQLPAIYRLQFQLCLLAVVLSFDSQSDFCCGHEPCAAGCGCYATGRVELVPCRECETLASTRYATGFI